MSKKHTTLNARIVRTTYVQPPPELHRYPLACAAQDARITTPLLPDDHLHWQPCQVLARTVVIQGPPGDEDPRPCSSNQSLGFQFRLPAGPLPSDRAAGRRRWLWSARSPSPAASGSARMVTVNR